jgi:hypothetical protein
VFDQKLCASGFEVRVGRERGGPLDEGVVCCRRVGVGCGCCVIEGCKDSRRPSLFDEVADDLVIEIFDRCPFDLFTDVFFLFSFERQLDEDLLKLFVYVIDAKLFEAVVLNNYFSRRRRLAEDVRPTWKISNP